MGLTKGDDVDDHDDGEESMSITESEDEVCGRRVFSSLISP
jgi:hypothetical protein